MQPSTLRATLALGILSLLATNAEAAYLIENGTTPAGSIGSVVYEGFENATFPAQPTSLYYTRTTSGTGLASIATSQFDTGAQSYQLDGTATGASLDLDFTTTTTNLCTAGGMRFAIRANEDVGSWVATIRESSTNEAKITVNMAGDVVTLTNDNSLGVVTSTSNGIGIPTAASSSWAHYGITCNGGTEVIFVNYDTGSSQTVTGTASGTITPTVIRFSSVGAGASGPAIHIDSLQWGLSTARTAFCTDPSVIDYDANPATPTTSTGASDDYGYSYRRGGTFFDQSEADVSGIGLSTGFDYEGTTSESSWDYSAKSFSVGTKALHENVTIEADDTGGVSVFRVNFHTAVGTSPDDTSKGNGLTSGHFADHIEAKFLEEDNSWRIGFYYVNGGSVTALGSTFAFGDANDATQFTVWLDTRSTANAGTTFNAAFGSDNWYTPGGGSTSAGPFIALTSISGSAGPSGEEVAKLKIQYLSSIAGTPFTDDTVGDVWNVGYGAGILTAKTAVDENDQGGRANTGDEGGTDSTCIFDDAGTMVLAGSLGGTPESQLPSLPDDEAEDCTEGGFICVDSANVPEGFTVGTFSALLGVFLVAGISAGGYFALGRSPFVAGAFAIVGLILANILGLIPLWVIIVLVILGTATIFLAVKKSAG